ncbi:WD40-repeat-containing domain protein, partial [Xylogone sp. PMI_703]
SVTNDTSDNVKGRLGLSLLYSPSEPLIDFIFVHGLGGGSRKTWSKTNSVGHYWPQEWLPKDPAFKNVRVHTFGYDSNWIRGNDNCLNIYHFGQSLLGEMSISPYFGDSHTPIVLVGHSMGGLVIKKAYILASQSKLYEPLRKRIHAVFFLATPHRGSDMAKLLNNILEIAYSLPAYVAELEQNSEALRSINDDFPNYINDLDIWSFYETKKVTRGPFSALIVDPNSATLGYEKEKRVPMNADHRSICKFESPIDSNYLTFRNAIASVVDSILTQVLQSKEKLRRQQIEKLEVYLGVSQDQELNLVANQEARIEGTCLWLPRRESYLEWRDFNSSAPQILWVTGSPAAGKSVLAGHIVEQLQAMGMNCSYFFFKHGDNTKAQLVYSIKSLAFQMACRDPQARESLLKIQEDGTRLKNDNERLLWRTIFLAGIFQARLSRHHWVIDGLDESEDSSSFLDLLLSILHPYIPLRVLFISRKTAKLKNSFDKLGIGQFHEQSICSTDILPDIRLLVEARTKSLMVDEDYRGTLVESIVERSQGNFLWTTLVLNELQNCHSKESIHRTLEDIPRHMEPFYRRTLDLMSKATYGKDLTKAILIWVTCAMRPITIYELREALLADTKNTFFRLGESIQILCGQLVIIDRSGRLQMIHETAREFLLSNETESEFSISVTKAHTRLAKACLTYLISEQMKPPRTSRRSVIKANSISQRSKFASYACEAFSYHIRQADPLSSELLSLINMFLNSNILTWIEVIAETKTIAPLLHAAKDLYKYAETCLADKSSINNEIQTIRDWALDLNHIVTKFTPALMTSPSAIYSLILPFCPTDTAAYKSTSRGRKLSLLGITTSQWEDRVSCIDFRQHPPSAICYGEKFFAVGLNTGMVELYHARSYQKYIDLDHGELVKLLCFQNGTNLLASCGQKTIRIWDTCEGQTLYVFETPKEPMSSLFDTNRLIIACNRNYLASWDLGNNGIRLPDKPWKSSGEEVAKKERQATAISISLSHRMMAVTYTWKPVVLWDLEEDAYYGTCGKKLPNGNTSTHPIATLLFNPNPAIELLAISYLDGELVLLNPFNDQELTKIRASCYVLAASPDGRLLAGNGGSGVIAIYKFDTLKLIYRVSCFNMSLRGLAFSNDGLHLADVRGTQCNIWEPGVPLQILLGDDNSEEMSAPVYEAISKYNGSKINVMVLYSEGGSIFCGKEDGSVALYDLKTGRNRGSLYSHPFAVRFLAHCSQKHIIISIDMNNRIYVYSLNSEQGQIKGKLLFQSQQNGQYPVTQILCNEGLEKFIISTRGSDHLWSVNDQQEANSSYSETPGIRIWAQHQQSPNHALCFSNGTVKIYAWGDLSQIFEAQLVIPSADMQLKSIHFNLLDQMHLAILELCQQYKGPATRGLHLFDATSFNLEDGHPNPSKTSEPPDMIAHPLSGPANETEVNAATLLPELFPQEFSIFAKRVSHVIGFRSTSKLVFLDTDSWICSADLSNLTKGQRFYLRHFFIPYDWFSSDRKLVYALTSNGIIIAKDEEVAIIKDGFEFIEKVDFGNEEV